MKGFQIFFSFSRGHSGERRQEGKERGGDNANANVFSSASADLVQTLVHRTVGKNVETQKRKKKTNKKKLSTAICVLDCTK